MKINRLDAHDRLLHYKKQSDQISFGCQECIKNRPEEFGNHPFYIYAHARTHDNGVTKRLIWQPRLCKPQIVETNSMLFKYYPQTDTIKIIWMIPDERMWNQYKKGNLTESQIIIESIHNYKYNRKMLLQTEEDDLADEKVDAIYTQIAMNRQNVKLMDNLWSRQVLEEESSIF